MTKTERALLERYLDTPYGSREALDALADLIEILDRRSK